MRVYEFAKQFGVPTKKLLTELQRGGFAVASHMSVLDEKAVVFLKNLFTLKSAQKIKEQKQVQKESISIQKNYFMRL